MTALKNHYARAFSKISPSRYPARTLRDCKVFDKVGNYSSLEPLETPGNATGNVAKVLVKSPTVVGAHRTGSWLHPIQLKPCFTF